MVTLRDMLGLAPPQSGRKLARMLGLQKYTVWRRRMLVFFSDSNVAARFWPVSASMVHLKT